MSAVAPPADVRDARAGTARARIARVLASADARALAALGLLFAVLSVVALFAISSTSVVISGAETTAGSTRGTS